MQLLRSAEWKFLQQAVNRRELWLDWSLKLLSRKVRSNYPHYDFFCTWLRSLRCLTFFMWFMPDAMCHHVNGAYFLYLNSGVLFGTGKNASSYTGSRVMRGTMPLQHHMRHHGTTFRCSTPLCCHCNHLLQAVESALFGIWPKKR